MVAVLRIVLGDACEGVVEPIVVPDTAANYVVIVLDVTIEERALF